MTAAWSTQATPLTRRTHCVGLSPEGPWDQGGVCPDLPEMEGRGCVAPSYSFN